MSKIQELKDKHPEFTIDLIGDLSQRDPSGTNKYLPFMVKVSAEAVREYFSSKNYRDDVFIQLITLVNDFDKYCKLNLITNKDIYSYAEIKEIEAAVKTAKEQNTTREVKDGQTIVLYEDKEKMLVKCLTRDSAILYGKNTKWCTSAVKDNRFGSYASEGVLLYFIHKPSNSDVPAVWRKLGFNQKNTTDTRIIWNAKSEQVSTFDAMLLFGYVGKEIMDIVYKEFDLCIPNTSLTKDDDGKIILNQKLFSKQFWNDRQNTILNYVDDLKDVRLKNAKAEIVTYDPLSEIERGDPDGDGAQLLAAGDFGGEVEAPPIEDIGVDMDMGEAMPEGEPMGDRRVELREVARARNQAANLDGISSMANALRAGSVQPTFSERMGLREAPRREPVPEPDPERINFDQMIANEARSNVSFEQAVQALADRDNGRVSMMSGISSLSEEMKSMAAPDDDYGISELKAMATQVEGLPSDLYGTITESATERI
jgi:hypothetical protein